MRPPRLQASQYFFYARVDPQRLRATDARRAKLRQMDLPALPGGSVRSALRGCRGAAFGLLFGRDVGQLDTFSALRAVGVVPPHRGEGDANLVPAARAADHHLSWWHCFTSSQPFLGRGKIKTPVL